MIAAPPVRVENLTKEYAHSWTKRRIRALDEINLEIEEGTLLALLGPNGAGKTTLIKILCGLITPTSGTVCVAGYSLREAKQKAIESIGVVFEGNRNIYWYMTPLENLHYFANLRGKPSKEIRRRVEELLTFLNLEGKLAEPVNKLSRGMQQKVALAVALVTDPKILLLDEPTLGLDVESDFLLREKIRELAKKNKKTILLASHQMPLVEDLAEEIAIIDSGRLILRERMETLRQTFDVNRYILQVEGHVRSHQLEPIGLLGRVQVDNGQNVTTLDVTLTHSRNLFELISLVKETNVRIISITKDNPRLEDIFLDLVTHSSRPAHFPRRGVSEGEDRYEPVSVNLKS